MKGIELVVNNSKDIMKKKILTVLVGVMALILTSCSSKQVTIKFDTDGGSPVKEMVVDKGSTLKDLPTTEKEGYLLKYWSIGSEEIKDGYIVNEDVTLKANWVLKGYENPVWAPILADPSVIKHDGMYYAFGTQDDGVWGDTFGVQYGPILKSKDLINWDFAGSVFKPYNRPGMDWASLNAGVWAPDVVKIGDKFVLYYSLSIWGDPNPGIGVAVADHPLGPWTDNGKLFTSEEIGVNNSIDSTTFQDEDGNVYLIWGSFRGLYGVELTKDGLNLKGGIDYAKENKVHIAGLDTSTPWNGDTYEAPYVIHKEGYYYMFVSSGTCCNGHNSTYNIRVGRSKNPLGPYIDSEGQSMLGTNRGHQVLKKNDRFVGTGHNGIVMDDDNNFWIVYHAFDTLEDSHVGNSNRRSMLLDLLIWDKDGWPSVEGLTPGINPDKKPVIK